jgi:hypothetical protein
MRIIRQYNFMVLWLLIVKSWCFFKNRVPFFRSYPLINVITHGAVTLANGRLNHYLTNRDHGIKSPMQQIDCLNSLVMGLKLTITQME